MISHVKRIHLKIRNQECNFCEFKTFDKSSLVRHNKSIHGTSGKGLVFRQNTAMHSSGEIKCHKCDYRTSTGQELTKHMQEIHSRKYLYDKEATPKRCQVCEYLADTDEQLTGHLMTSHMKAKVVEKMVKRKGSVRQIREENFKM